MAKILLISKKSYKDVYDPNILFPIARKQKREEINIAGELPFKGIDIWRAYEISWLNLKGKPKNAIGEFVFLCDSKFLIESKSLKLYLNSFNQTKFSSVNEVETVIQKDLSRVTDSLVQVRLQNLSTIPKTICAKFNGICLDELDVTCKKYIVTPQYLSTNNKMVKETLYSNLLKSNCLVTKQPDWGAIQVSYSGKKINREGLLKYIVSYRSHNDFHEQCVERFFMDIMHFCMPRKLTVHAKYTRRGGIDINPIRSTQTIALSCYLQKNRDIRQ